MGLEVRGSDIIMACSYTWNMDVSTLIGIASLMSPPLATSAPLGPAEGDQVCEDEQLHEHLLLWELGLAATGPSLRPSLAMYWLNS